MDAAQFRAELAQGPVPLILIEMEGLCGLGQDAVVSHGADIDHGLDQRAFLGQVGGLGKPHERGQLAPELLKGFGLVAGPRCRFDRVSDDGGHRPISGSSGSRGYRDASPRQPEPM
ncbi:hypothetical protein ACFC0C_37660 [Streptomyces sp. NPDC056178]|uniref:hypothetical protein n=1 Tax=unclassified Streptomyces TaxID=2593676 RepID=UPI0035DA66A0